MKLASLLKTRLSKKRIRNEMILVFIAIFSLQFVLLFVFINYSYTKTVVDKQAHGFISNLNTVSGLLDGVMSQAEYQLMSVVGDSSLNEIYRRFIRKKTYEDDPDTRAIISKLYQFSLNNRFVDGGYLYLYKPRVIFPSTTYPDKLIEINDPTQYQWIQTPFLPDSKVTGWTISYLLPPRDESNKTLLIYKMKITNRLSGETMGEASINMKVSTVRNTLLEYGVEQKGSLFFIADKNGTIMLSNNHGDTAQSLTQLYGLSYRAGSGYYEMQMGGKRWLVAYVPMQKADWSIIKAMPYSDFSTGLAEQLPLALWGIAVISMTTTLLALLLFSRGVYRPIGILSGSMDRVIGGDMSVRIEMKRHDEFSALVAGFNEMLERINRLIAELYTQKLLTKDAEIQTLRAQLNPHFLYNTLDTLHWMAKLGENEKVSELTMALSRFYQLSLNKGNSITTVRDAAELAWEYLHIQMIRQGDRLKADIDADETLLDVRMPHNLLQPLLENAVLHGISKKNSPGHISVAFSKTDGGMRIAVSDDGAGMPQDRLAELRRALASEEDRPDGSFLALRNIHRQLNLLYGEGEWITVESAEGAGAKVTITIPDNPGRTGGNPYGLQTLDRR